MEKDKNNTFAIYIDNKLYKELTCKEDAIWHLGAKYGGMDYNAMYAKGQIQWYENKCNIFINTDPSRQEWVYNFIGGGWNSEFAVTKEEAIEKAKIRWGKPEELDTKSFRTVSVMEMSNLMNQFD